MPLPQTNKVPEDLLNDPELIFIGKVVGIHGVKGALRVKCNEQKLGKFKKLKEVTLTGKGVQITHAVLETAVVKNTLVLILPKITTKEEAEKLLQHFVFGQKKDVAKLENDEWWVRDLIGLDVYTTTGTLVGTVCDVISTASDLLEISPLNSTKGETFYVPFVKELVPVVRLDLKRIEVNAIPGLLGD
jgi:16S rRNA processing protein RimM